MAITFDKKISDLEIKRENLSVSVLTKKKSEYNQGIANILDNPMEELDGESAKSILRELKEYHSMIKIIDRKMKHIPELTDELNMKINYYKEKRERVRNIPLYSDTEESIAEIFDGDVVYEYADEIGDGKLLNQLEDRTLSARRYLEILEKDYRKYIENIYKNIFPSVSPNQKTTTELVAMKDIVLPTGMIEKIRKDLKDNKTITVGKVEAFLKKELKKNNGNIKISHIRNIFTDNYDEALKYISGLIINYSEFSLIDIPKESNEKSEHKNRYKHENLKSTVSREEIANNIYDRQIRESLLSRLFEIKNLSDLESRISNYIDLFEELGYRFTDRENFKEELIEAINDHAPYRIEKDIKKILVFTINGTDCYEKVGEYGYYTFKLNSGRRIVGYPNGEIFTTCSHTDYDNIRENVKPPKDKME